MNSEKYLVLRSILTAVLAVIVFAAMTQQTEQDNVTNQTRIPLSAQVIDTIVETTIPQTTSTTISTTTSTTTTTTLYLPSDGKCTEWWNEAIKAGWHHDQLYKIGRIMWAESRCQPDVIGNGAYGLMQIQYNVHKDWLMSEFGFTKEELFIPYNNFLAAKWLYDYAENTYGCGYQPWYMSGNWC